MSDTPATVRGLPADRSLSGFWRRLSERLRPPRVSTVDAFRTYLEQRASFIAQKCAIDYCRGKTGLASYALFTEEPFLQKLDVCRWETFVTVLGDLFIVAEGHLRSHVPAGERMRLRDVLIDQYAKALSGLPAPVHRQEGWHEAIAAFTLRLQAASAGEPKQALDVADHSAKQLFDTLPIHSRMRELDEEVVYGAMRFRMIAVSQEMQRRLVAPDLVAALLKS